MLPSFFLGLLSALFGAAANLSARRVLTWASVRHTIGLSFGLIVVVLTPFAPFLFNLPAREGWGLFLLAVVIDAAANLLYFKSFEINTAAAASALLALSPFFTLAMLPIFDPQTSIRAGQVLGVLLVVAGVIVFSRGVYPPEASSLARRRSLRALAAPLAAALLFGANAYLIKYLFNNDLTDPYSYYYLRAILIGAVMLLALRPRLSWLNRSRLTFVSMRSLLVIAQWLLLLYALDLGNPAVVKAASEASPLFVLLFGSLFLKEPQNRTQLAGTVCLVIGLVFLAVG